MAVKRYWVCQFQVSFELTVIVNVTEVVLPEAGTDPVPVQPVLRYWIPVPPETGVGPQLAMITVSFGYECFPTDGSGEPY